LVSRAAASQPGAHTFDLNQIQRPITEVRFAIKSEDFDMSITASEIMTSPAIVVGPTASLAEIAGLLTSKHISAAPVCRPDGKLVGIVTEGDILRPFRESATARRKWWLESLAAGEDLSQNFLEYIRVDTRTAADVMVHHVIVAEEQTTLPRLAELMIKHGIKRLPVLRDGHVVGIVSRADLVAAIARAPGMEV
jgi:CBS domain-containing protein